MAFLKVKRAALDGASFDAVITDLSFKKDRRSTNLEFGKALIAALWQDFPELPIIMYSMKDQLQKVRQLINKYNISGYVCKDRRGSLELSEAISAVSNGALYVSPQVSKALSPKTQLEIDDFYDQLKTEEARGLLMEKRGNSPTVPRILEATT